MRTLKDLVKKCLYVTKYRYFVFAFVFAFSTNARLAAQSAAESRSHFLWDTLAVLPPQNGVAHPGVAGPFSGISNNALIVAGGANFPDAPPWQGGVKTWSRSVYVLEKDTAGYRWADAGFQLKQPVGYGISLAVSDGLMCIGGNNAEGVVSDIVMLRWNPQSRVIEQTILASLPDGFEATGAAVISDRVYITGIQGARNRFITVQTTRLLASAPAVVWEDLTPCPGPPRRFMGYAAQNSGRGMSFYLFGGRSDATAEREAILLGDSYAYDVLLKKWRRIADVPHAGPQQSLVAAAALPYGISTIFIFGGDGGKRFLERSALESEIRNAQEDGVREALSARLKQAFESHDGFDRTVYSYNTVTNTFESVSQLPHWPPVTTHAFLWHDQVVLPSGEIRPGIRTPVILRGTPLKTTGSFGLVNYALLIAYLVCLVILGVYFSFRQKTTDDYFKGGGRIPWWAAGLSVFGTALSAITFMAIPAKTYATDWSYFLYNMSVLLVTPIVIMYFIPFFRRLNLTTAYEYLEKRFNLIVRLFGSASFIIFQLGRIAIVLYLPAIALSIVSGIDIYFCIMAMGLLSLVYTMIGGIEAVIWTDVIQVIVLMGGTILSLVIIVFSLDGSLISSIETAAQHGKFNILDFKLTLIEPTFWVVVIGGFFANLITYSSDQTLVQRYLTTDTESAAGKTAWTNAVLVVPASILFFATGTALYLFYAQNPAKLDPFSQDLDGIFPWYIIQTLPNGLSGILIAGLFSAAMSTLSSSMNSAATAFTTDFFQRFTPHANIRQSLYVAKWATFVVGFVGTASAIWMSTSDIASLWDSFATLLGLFTGGLGGLFLLGIISRQANGKGAIVGLLLSSVIQYFVSTYTDLHLFLYAAVGLISCVIIGHIASLMISDTHNPGGKALTVYNNVFKHGNKG